MNPKLKICSKCLASYVPEPHNPSNYCNNCLKRSLKTKKPHFFIEDDILAQKSIEDEILMRKFKQNDNKNRKT